MHPMQPDAPAVAPDVVVGPQATPPLDGLLNAGHKPPQHIFTEKLCRLLTHPLYASWPGPGEGRSFLVLTNVGWFYQVKKPPVVPDCLLSVDVTGPEDVHVKPGHSYYQWSMGKPPDVIIEAVSDKLGGEETFKRKLYARQGATYYAIYDPDHYLSPAPLRTFVLNGGTYHPTPPGPWPGIGLGLRLWEGVFEGYRDTWLRWCDATGEIIPTAEERAALLAERAARTEQAEQRAAQAEERVRQLEEELRRRHGESPQG